MSFNSTPTTLTNEFYGNSTLTTALYQTKTVNTSAISQSVTVLHNITAPPLPAPFNVDAFKLVMAVLYAIIFFVGMPGNVLVILTIIRVPKMRSVKNIFIANLAIGDLINIIWCLPTSLLSLYISWPYGEIVCKYIFPMADVIIANTIFTMVAITIDRFRAICYIFNRKITLRTAIIVLIIGWIFSYCLLGVPLVISTHVSAGYWVERSCNLTWKSQFHRLLYRIGSFVCIFCIPFTVVLFCFLKIKARLIDNIRFATSSMRCRTTLQRAKKHQRLIKMLLVIFLCFTICYLPINVLLLTLTFHPELHRWNYAGILFQLAIALLFFNSIMNPIILYRLSRDYKAAYFQQIKCLCPNSEKFSRGFDTIRRRYSSASSITFTRRSSSFTDVETSALTLSRKESLHRISEYLASTPDTDKTKSDIVSENNLRLDVISSNERRKKSVTWSENMRKSDF